MVNNLTERELKILSYLIDEDDFINGDDLSSRLGISKKTIQREIGSMNEIGTTSRKRTHKIDKF